VVCQRYFDGKRISSEERIPQQRARCSLSSSAFLALLARVAKDVWDTKGEISDGRLAGNCLATLWTQVIERSSS
jgi:hypothetical protein